MKDLDNKKMITGLSDNYIGRSPTECEPERKTSYTFEELEEIYHNEKRQELYEKSTKVRVFAACSYPDVSSLPRPNLSFQYWAGGGYYKAHMIMSSEMKADLRFMWATSASEAADIYFVCCMSSKITQAVISVLDFHDSENSGTYLVRRDRIGKEQEYLGKKK